MNQIVFFGIFSLVLCFLSWSQANPFPNDQQGYYTNINSNNVNLRVMPNINTKIKKQLSNGTKIRVCGISPTKDTINGYSEYWFYVETYGNYGRDYETGNPIIDNYGWVFGEFIEKIEKIEPVEQNINIENKEIISKNTKIEIKEQFFKINDNNSMFMLYDWCPGYTYKNCPGIYIMDNKTNQLLSYIPYAFEGDYEKIDISSDNKYLIMGAYRWGMGWINVVNIVSKTFVFSGEIVGSLKFDGIETVDICYSDYFDNLSELNGKEISDGEKQIKKRPQGDQWYPGYIFNLNFRTKERKMVDAIWFQGQ